MINNINIHKHVLNSITFPVIIIDDLKNIKMVNSAAETFFKSSLKVLVEKKNSRYFSFFLTGIIFSGQLYKNWFNL